jgi:hypothetical protein
MNDTFWFYFRVGFRIGLHLGIGYALGAIFGLAGVMTLMAWIG